MSGPDTRHSTTTRSKMYDRYDVEINTSSGAGGRSWFTEEEPKREPTIEEQERAQLKELATIILRSYSWKSKIMAVILLILTMAMAIRTIHGIMRDMGKSSPAVVSSSTKARPYMDPDAHKRNNPFAPAGHVSVMEGVLEVKRVGGPKPPPQQSQQNEEEGQWEEFQRLEEQQRLRIEEQQQQIEKLQQQQNIEQEQQIIEQNLTEPQEQQEIEQRQIGQRQIEQRQIEQRQI
jgi:hypothetical protein